MGDDLEDAYVEAMVDQSFGMPNKRSLREELAELDELEATGVMLSLDSHIVAAARLFERLLPGEESVPVPCPDDLGPNVSCNVAHFETRQVWDEGIVEAVAKAIHPWDDNKEIVRERARAVLSALVELLTEKVET